MQKIKTFFHVFTNSLFPNEKYYKKIVNTNFNFSFQYFFFFIFSLSILSIFLFLSKFSSSFEIKELNNQLDLTLSKFPKNLIIKVEDNKVITNFNRPFIAWFYQKNIPNPIITIDPNASLDKIKKYDSNILINSDYILFKTKSGINKVDIYTTKINSRNLTINKIDIEQLRNILNKLTKIIPFFSTVLFFLIFSIVPLIYFAIKFFYLVIISFLVFLIFRPIKKIHYKKILQISFHAATIPTLVGAFIQITIYNPKVSLMFFVLTLLFLISAIYEAYIYQEKNN